MIIGYGCCWGGGVHIGQGCAQAHSCTSLIFCRNQYIHNTFLGRYFAVSGDL